MEIFKRSPDWRPRLAEYMAEIARLAFRPGRHDCALFVAGAVKAMTGQDLGADWRGKYRTLTGGQKALVRAGFADHIALVASLCPEVQPALAQVGDVAVLPSGDGEFLALGIIQGPKVYVLEPGGLALVSRLHAKRAFTV